MEDRIPAIWIIDDDAGAREAMRILIESVDVRAKTCADAREFLDQFDSTVPSCLVIDVRMPAMSGLELQERLIAEQQCPPIIFVTGFADVSLAVRAMKNGAFDLIEKPFSPQYLLERVQAGLRQDIKAHEDRMQSSRVLERLAMLTPREDEVLRMLVMGYTNRRIGEAMNLSSKTIEVHRARIMEKTNAQSLAGLVRMVLSVEKSRGEIPRSRIAGEGIERSASGT